MVAPGPHRMPKQVTPQMRFVIGFPLLERMKGSPYRYLLQLLQRELIPIVGAMCV